MIKFQNVLLGCLLSITAVSAVPPHYVGTNLDPFDQLSLDLQYTPTKKESSITGNSGGHLILGSLEADYRPMETMNVRAGVPFFYSTSQASNTGKSRFSMGNFNLGLLYTRAIGEIADDWKLGWATGGDIYFPAARKNEGQTPALATAPTTFLAFHPKTTSAHLLIGFFLDNQKWAIKSNVGYAYANLSSGGSDKHRNYFDWQSAFSFKPMQELALNLEYNVLVLDRETAAASSSSSNEKYRHQIAPSVSGGVDRFFGSFYIALPIDKSSRDVDMLSAGLQTGLRF